MEAPASITAMYNVVEQRHPHLHTLTNTGFSVGWLQKSNY
jgi:hypothetical protein